MANDIANKSIPKASPHTIKKFELVEEYVKSWAQKLMLNEGCYGLVFIDCMSNGGIYKDVDGNLIKGTPLRVADILADVSHSYPTKRIQLFLNDNSATKISQLKEYLPKNERNFEIITSTKDRNEILELIRPQLCGRNHLHYFLFYDPYDASINWSVLIPFLNYWGEVMINHMVSDPVRAISQVKKSSTKEKYANTYLTEFENLVPYGTDKQAYEERIEEIINKLKGKRKYFVGAFPFYNSQNSQLYSLIHCTSNIEGFKLYKRVAWKVFGGKSSMKVSHIDKQQLAFDFDNPGFTAPATDNSCFTVTDIAKFLQKSFSGQQDIPLDSIWKHLDNHPIFPSEGFRKEIREELKKFYGVKFGQILHPETKQKQIVVSFLKGKL